MADEILKRDENHVPVLGAVTDNAAQEIRMLRVDPTTGRLMISVDGISVAATIDVNSTTTLDPGEDATVVNSGTIFAAELDFGIPAGSVIYSTVLIPDNAVGRDGDWAFSTAVTSEVFYKSGGAWALVNSIRGATGADGDDAYVYIAYASADDGTDFTNTFDPALNYVAIKTTTTPLSPPVVGDFAGLWKNYKGATGLTGPTPTINDTSVTSNVIATGAKTFSVSSATNAWQLGDWLIISSAANSANYMTGYITAYTGPSVTVEVIAIGGSGTKTDWNLSLSGVKGADGIGAGDVLGPATNTADYIPQWNGSNSKTLKDGLAVPAGGLAGITLVNGKTDKLTPIALQTSNYNANASELIPCSIAGGSFAVTLPDSPADGTQIEIQLILIGSAYTLEVKCSGTDHFARTTGPTSLYMSYAFESMVLQYQESTGVWFVNTGAAGSNFASGFPGIDAFTPITNEDISIDTTTRVLTVTPPLGYFNIFVNGADGRITRIRKTGNIDFDAFTDTSGMWYFYFNSSGTPVTTQTPWTVDDFPEVAPVYRILWNNTLYNFTVASANVNEGDTYTNNGQTFTVRQTYTGTTTVKMTGTGAPAAGNLIRATGTGTDPLVVSAFSVAPKLVAQYAEYHLNDIPADTHAWMHLYGAIWNNGFTIASNAKTTGSPAANGSETVIALSTGSVRDDNLEYTITNDASPTDPWQQDLGDTTPATLTASNSAYLTTYRQNAAGLVTFRDETRFPFDWNTVTNIPNYITSLGVRTPVTNLSFFVYFVYVTQNPVAGVAVKLVSATAEYTTIVNARAYTWTDIQNTYSTLNDGEVRPLYRLIFEYKTTYDAGAKYSVLREIQDLRKAQVTSTTAASGSIPASSVTFVPYGTTGATNVQSAIDELTDEKANTALSNLASVAINTTLVSDTDNTDSLGTTAIAWSDLFLGSGAVITFNSAPSTADVTITHSANTLTIGGGNIAMGGNNITGGGTINGTIITASTQIIADGNSDTPATCPLIDFRRSRDGDPTDNVSDNDVLGELRFRGYHTSAYYEGAIIRGVVNGTPGASDMPAELIFATSADGSATPTTRLTIGADGTSTFAGTVALGANSITMSGSIGVTGTRVTKGWFTDLECTNAIAGSVTGNAGTVTNATLTTALTVNTGTLTLTANAANNSVLTIGAGAVSVSGANTGDNAANSSSTYIGTTAVALNRASAALTLAGITLTTPDIGTPSAGVLSSCSGYANDVNLTAGKQINLTLPTSDATCTGHVTSSINAGYTTAIGDLMFFGSGGKWLEVDADAVATCKGLMAIALEVKNDGDAIKVALPNSMVHLDAWGWTAGDTLYAGETLGAMQNAIPTGPDAIIKVVAFAIDGDTIYFNPSPDQQSTVA